MRDLATQQIGKSVAAESKTLVYALKHVILTLFSESVHTTLTMPSTCWVPAPRPHSGTWYDCPLCRMCSVLSIDRQSILWAIRPWPPESGRSHLWT